MTKATPSTNATVLCLLAAFAMAYGWAYRGTVGSEPGATVPGALLGLTLCLGSGRPDWHHRAAVAGLFGAIGWAWGGSLSYMEQTFYVLSGSFPDVLYGYAMLFFLGALWAGIGGAVLGLALTEPVSVLEGLIRPFTAVCAAFLTAYLLFFFTPSLAEAYETLSVRQFHRTVWLAAAITLVVSGLYWLLRRQDRPGAALLFCGAGAWWIGYLVFTKFGGLRLAPLHRGEGWGGLVGILIVLLVYLERRRNRAALLLSLYGILGGGLAFALAVFLRHPLAIHWGPFHGNWPHWRFAEANFGFFMGLAMARGALRLIRRGLATPGEDRAPAPLDVYAVFVMLVALNWMNFRRHAAPLLARSAASAAPPFLGVATWIWFFLAGALATVPVLYILRRYLRGDKLLAPPSAFGKGAILTLLILWVTLVGYTFQDPPNASNIASQALLWIPAVTATLLLLTVSGQGLSSPGDLDTPPSAAGWKTGLRYRMLCGFTPVFLLCITGLSIAMQNGPVEGMGRKRFGPDAYWRQTANLVGTWQAIGMKKALRDTDVRTTDLPLTRLTFSEDRDVTATLPSGATDDTHQWFLKNQYIWLHWRGKSKQRSERLEIPLEFQGRQFSLAWPPAKPEGYLVFERVPE
jgi:hypothetical protein